MDPVFFLYLKDLGLVTVVRECLGLALGLRPEARPDHSLTNRDLFSVFLVDGREKKSYKDPSTRRQRIKA